MSLLVRKSLAKHVSIIQSDSYHFWCKVDKEVINSTKDLYIAFLYIVPSSSNITKAGMSLNFETLQAECAIFENKGATLLLGDFNSRTNDVIEYIENDELDDYLPTDDQYIPDIALDKRITADKSPLNTNGSAMIEFCKSTGYRILNGRVDKENSSGFTCFSSHITSVVDYCLLKLEYFSFVNSFKVHEISDLSDHSPLEIEISTDFEIKNRDTTPVAQSKNLPLSSIYSLKNRFKNKFYVNDSTITEIKYLINSTETDSFLKSTSEQLNDEEMPLHSIVDSLRCKLINISEKCFQTKKIFSTTKRNTPSYSKNRWFDNECKNKKQSLNRARKMYQESLRIFQNFESSSLPRELRQAYFQQRREYKNL